MTLLFGTASEARVPTPGFSFAVTTTRCTDRWYENRKEKGSEAIGASTRWPPADNRPVTLAWASVPECHPRDANADVALAPRRAHTYQRARVDHRSAYRDLVR